MDVILISAKAIVPLLAFMAIGFFFKQRRYLSKESAKELNIIVFRYFLSLSCAQTIYKANLKEDVELLPVLVVACSITGLFLLAWLIVPHFVKDRTRIPVMIQGIYKSNYAILGLPIVESICGAGNMGIASVIIVILVPLNNAFSAYIFEKYTGNATSRWQILLKVVKNPLVLASLIGFALNIAHVQIPEWIMGGIVSKISALTTPLAMIALGATFEFSFIRKYRTHLTWALLAKLVFAPALIVPISIALGLRGPALVSVMVYAVAPNAVNSYSTAVAMGGDADLANEIVIMSSILSMVTMFAWFVLVGLTVSF